MPAANGGQRNPAALFAKTVAEQVITEALIEHHRIIEKIRTDFPAGELTLQGVDSFND